MHCCISGRSCDQQSSVVSHISPSLSTALLCLLTSPDPCLPLTCPSTPTCPTQLNTSVVSKVYESHKLTQGEELGKPRRLGARMPPGPDGQDPVFGKASQRGNEPGAAELIRGWYTPEEQAPDPDLGKSLHEGFRNPTSPNMRVRSLRCHWCT